MSFCKVWVVEMHTGRRWEPTVGVRLTREDGRAELRAWRSRNVGRFRLSAYQLLRAVR